MSILCYFFLVQYTVAQSLVTSAKHEVKVCKYFIIYYIIERLVAVFSISLDKLTHKHDLNEMTPVVPFSGRTVDQLMAMAINRSTTATIWCL